MKKVFTNAETRKSDGLRNRSAQHDASCFDNNKMRYFFYQKRICCVCANLHHH